MFSSPGRSHTRTQTRAAQRGASMLEYALLVALLAMISIAAVRGFGESVRRGFVNTTEAVAGEGTFPTCSPDNLDC